MLITGEPTAYHVMSRTALDGYVLGDVEKEGNRGQANNLG